MKIEKEKIAAVVVTYNKKELLKECLDALLKQTRSLDSIILIDNTSTDGTPEFLKENGYLDNSKIDYLRLPENTGGAGGFHKGMKRGYEKGFDRVWCMDDDAIPSETALKELSNYSKKYSDCVLNSLVKDRYSGRLSFGLIDEVSKKIYLSENEIKKDNITNYGAFFNGTLIPKKVIKKVGFPMKKLFIWGDEREYLRRLRLNDVKIITVVGSKVFHPLSEYQKIFFGFITKNVPAWKKYYEQRNNILIEREYHNYGRVFVLITVSLLTKLLLVLLYETKKVSKIKAILIGTIHGFRGISGKYEPAFKF